ncbi:MAG: ABC transporter substrate-binding protein [Alphaproteobacteria bacterium]|nr:ABC transporter substrate-binding protein [Alphaproteobacteria bacterium]
MAKPVLALAAAAVAFWGLAGSAAAQQPVKIRISWAAIPAHLTPMIPVAPPGVYRHYGKSYVVETTRMAGSGPALQALAAGELQLAGIGPQALVLGVTRAKLELRAVAQLMSQGVKGHPHTKFYGRKGEIKSVDELKGKIIATNARGSTMDAAIRALMGQKGWREGRDYRMVEVGFGAMIAAIESKRIDVGPLLEPFNLMADKKGDLAPVFDTQDVLGGTETLNYVATADWAQKNRAVLLDFLEDNLRLRRWLLDPANRAAALKLLSETAKQPVSAFEDWAFTTKGFYYAPDGLSDVKLLQKNIEDLKRLEVLPNVVDMAKYVDNSYVVEAARRLK